MKKYILGTGISLCLLMSSCLNDSFLEVYPKGQQTEATVFTTYDNFKTYIRMIRGRRTKYSAEILSRTI